MGLYSDLTDEQLDVEIAAFRDARRSVLMPGAGGVGVVKRIRDADRQLEYTSANLADLNRELQALLNEKNRRINGGGGGQAIAVEFD
jgi:hypothetical protein